MSRAMRKRVLCHIPQSDQRLCFCCLDSVISLVSVIKISSLMLASVAEQAGLSLTWSETPVDTFCHVEAQMYWLCPVQTIFIRSAASMFFYCFFYQQAFNFCLNFVYWDRWAPPSEFVSSSIPSWQILTAHAQPFRGARDLAFAVWRFLLTHCLHERAAEVLARLHGCASSPEPLLLIYALSTKFAWRGPDICHQGILFQKNLRRSLWENDSVVMKPHLGILCHFL